MQNVLRNYGTVDFQQTIPCNLPHHTNSLIKYQKSWGGYNISHSCKTPSTLRKYNWCHVAAGVSPKRGHPQAGLASSGSQPQARSILSVVTHTRADTTAAHATAADVMMADVTVACAAVACFRCSNLSYIIMQLVTCAVFYDVGAAMLKSPCHNPYFWLQGIILADRCHCTLTRTQN